MKGWHCTASARVAIRRQQKEGDSWKEDVEGEVWDMEGHTFHSDAPDWGIRLALMEDLLDPKYDYLSGGEVDGALRVEMSVASEVGQIQR